MCEHGALLLRHKRSIWQKLMRIKKIYVCRACGYTIRVKS